MLNDTTQEIGCDGCSISTADGEMDAIANAWLVDAQAVPRRHICPVCLAGAHEPSSQALASIAHEAARSGSARRHAGRLGLAPG